MLGRLVALGSVVAILTLFALLQLTTPNSIGPLGILFVFILMYVSILGVLTYLIYGYFYVYTRLAKVLLRRPSRLSDRMSIRQAYYYASVVALAPVMLIGMQSVGEVGVYDLLLIVIFIVIACMYITKRTR